jgi:hypothetical protein
MNFLLALDKISFTLVLYEFLKIELSVLYIHYITVYRIRLSNILREYVFPRILLSDSDREVHVLRYAVSQIIQLHARG